MPLRPGRLQRLRAWPVRHLPVPLLAQPFELFLAVLCALNGVTLLLSRDYEASSVEATLPHPLPSVWGGMLVAGGVLLAWGVLRNVVRAERLGLLLLGNASLVYAIAIVSSVGPQGGGVAASLVLAFALACLVRAYVLRLELLLSQQLLTEDAAWRDAREVD